MAGEPLRVLLLGERVAFREALAFLLAREPDLAVMTTAVASPAGEGRADVTVVDVAPGRGVFGDGVAEVRAPARQGIVVALTDGAAERERAMRAGARRVVDKGGTFAEVLQAIRAAGVDRAATVPVTSARRRAAVADTAGVDVGRVGDRLLATGKRFFLGVPA